MRREALRPQNLHCDSRGLQQISAVRLLKAYLKCRRVLGLERELWEHATRETIPARLPHPRPPAQKRNCCTRGEAVAALGALGALGALAALTQANCCTRGGGCCTCCAQASRLLHSGGGHCWSLARQTLTERVWATRRLEIEAEGGPSDFERARHATRTQKQNLKL